MRTLLAFLLLSATAIAADIQGLEFAPDITGLSLTANVVGVAATGSYVEGTSNDAGTYTIAESELSELGSGTYTVRIEDGSGTQYAVVYGFVWDGSAETVDVPQTGDSFVRLGAPAGASVSADIATIESQTDDIGVAGAGLTEAGGTGDQLTDITDRIGTPVDLGSGATLSGNTTDIENIVSSTSTTIGVAGAGLTESGGTGDQLTDINLPDQTMNITGNLSGSVGSVTGDVGGLAPAALNDILGVDISTSTTTDTLGEALLFSRGAAAGRQVLDADTKVLTIYASDGTTPLFSFLIGPNLTAPLTKTPQ